MEDRYYVPEKESSRLDQVIHYRDRSLDTLDRLFICQFLADEAKKETSMSEQQPLQSGYVNSNGTQLYYEIAGKGHPLVLIHGELLNNRIWDGQFLEFAQQYTVIRYDMRGFGKSQMGNVRYAHRQDLYNLLHFLEIDKTYLLGLSLGGSVAIDFTLEHPELVDALILASSSVGGYDDYSPEAQELDADLEAAVAEGDAAKLFDLWANAPMMPQAQEYPEAQRRYREILSDYSFVHYLHPVPQRELRPPAIKRFAEIRVPVLVLVGDEDSPDILAIAEYFKAGMPDVKKVTLRGARRMLNMERPEPFNRLVQTFLARHP